MIRFTSLRYAPWETRRLLRSRLARLLPTRLPTPPMSDVRPIMLADSDMLRFLAGITLTNAADLGTAQALYDHLAEARPGQPRFDDHVARGWFRPFLGRAYTSLEASRGGKRVAETWPALAAYLVQRYIVQLDLPTRLGADPALRETVARLSTEGGRWSDIGCPTPAWVAARLWEVRPWPADSVASLRWWYDRWDILGAPAIVAVRDWEAGAAQAFRSALFDALTTSVAPHDWHQAAIFFAQQGHNVTGGSIQAFAQQIPPVPPTLVERVRWLESQAVESASYQDGAAQDIDAIVELLLAEVEVELHQPVPHPALKQLLDLAVVRPDVMRAIARRLRSRPTLLADLLLDPLMSATAVMWVATCQRQSEGDDRDLQARTDAQLKAIAVEDAFDLFLHHLAADPLLADQAAGLMTVLYRWGALQPAYWQESTIAEQFAGILARQADAGTINDHLMAVCAPLDDFGASFRAALDLIAAAGLAETVDGDPLVDAWIQAVRAGKEEFTLDRLSPSAAGALLKLANRSPLHWSDFLRPLSFEAELAKAYRDDDHDRAGNLRRAIRSTVQMLSRAIGVLGHAAPDAAVDALIRTIAAGSREDPLKGRTAAFAVPGWTAPRIYRHNRPLADDLGAALSALPDIRQTPLMAAILEINEPLVLAELLPSAPLAYREAIIARLDGFTPDVAAKLYSFDAHLQRIKALLNAGRETAAARFMAFEEALPARASLPERIVSQFTHRLHLHLLRDEWRSIMNATVPVDLPQLSRDAARDILMHYQGIAALNDGGGRAAYAVECFEKLAKRHPHSASHAINLLAAHSQLILGTNYFRLLASQEQVEARKAIAEAEARLVVISGVSDEESDALNVNIAVLLLALNEPIAAALRLDALSVRATRPDMAAYQAIAMARTGRKPAALALITHIEAGTAAKSVLLEAARAHIELGTPYPALPVLSLNLESGPVRATLFTLQRLSASEQAVILGGQESRSLTDHLTREIRKAGASIANIVPMLQRDEDDVTSVMRELLTARFELVGWSVADQSKGGHTPNGNPGERDLIVLQRETPLTIIEAVIARETVPRDKLAAHFRKLLGYGQCQTYFHITYAWLASLDHLMATLEDIAEKEVPGDYRYQASRPLGLLGNQPGGFIATYEGGGGAIEVVFLVLDLEQAELQTIAREATATQSTTRRRRKPKASKA